MGSKIIMEKVVTIFILILTFTIKSNDSIHLNDAWNCILQYNRNSINKLNENTIALEQNRARLLKKNSLTFNSSIDPIEVDNGEDAYGKIKGGVTWSNDICDIGFSVNAYDTKYENVQIDLKVPIASSKKLQISLMEETIDITETISKLNINRLLHTSIKSVFSSKIQYDYLCSEIEIRKKINEDGEKILNKLSAFIKQGLIANNSLNPIKLYLYDNKLLISSLTFDKKIIIEDIYKNHLITEEIFTNLDLNTIFKHIKKDSSIIDFDYNNRSDSLTYLLNKLNEKQSNLNNWSLDFKSSGIFNNNSTEEISNVGLQLQYTLKNRQKKTYAPFKRSINPIIITDLSPEIITYGKSMKKYAVTAEKWINETFEKIKLGNINVIHEFTANLGIILSCHQNYANMKAKYNRRLLSNFTVLEQLPIEMRPNL